METDIVVSDESQNKFQSIMANKMMIMIAIVIFASIIVAILVVVLIVFNKYKKKPNNKTTRRKKLEPQTPESESPEECEHQKQKQQDDDDIKKLETLLSENRADQRKVEEIDEKSNLRDKEIVIDQDIDVESSTSYHIDSSSSADLTG
jgi:flagellar basal body-associated protein FliL